MPVPAVTIKSRIGSLNNPQRQPCSSVSVCCFFPKANDFEGFQEGNQSEHLAGHHFFFWIQGFPRCQGIAPLRLFGSMSDALRSRALQSADLPSCRLQTVTNQKTQRVGLP